MRREVFEPAGHDALPGRRMAIATRWATSRSPTTGKAIATSWSRRDGDVVPPITSAAAGGIRCSLDDMLTLDRNWLAPDASKRTGCRSEQRQALWAAQMPMPVVRAHARVGRQPFLRLRIRVAAGRRRWRVYRGAHRHAVGHVLGHDPAAGRRVSASSS